MDRFGEKVLCNPTVKLTKGKEYPLIDIDKINPGYKWVTNQEVVEYTGQSGAKFQDGDILFARITPCLENGKMAIAKTDRQKGTGSTELFVFRGVEGVTDTDYVYYLLCMKHMRQLAANSMTGASGRQRADLNFIKRIKWQFPSVTVQKKIVSALSAYDSLIETNNKRIKALEQMAENLYKEWFVRFRFPGYEAAKFNNGIPDDWEFSSLERIASFQNGYAFKSNELIDYPVEDSFDVFKQGHICRGGGLKNNGTKSWIPKSQCSELKKFILHKNDILMAMTDMKDNVAILGNTALMPIDEKYILNQRVGLLRPTHYRNTDFEYIYFLTNSKDFLDDLRGRANRGVQVNLSATAIKSTKVIVPSKSVNVLFSNMVNPYLEIIYNLSIQNDRLTKQRDLLLPRLMSCKLEV